MKLIGTIVMMLVAAFAGKFIYQKFGGAPKEPELPPGVSVSKADCTWQA